MRFNFQKGGGRRAIEREGKGKKEKKRQDQKKKKKREDGKRKRTDGRGKEKGVTRSLEWHLIFWDKQKIGRSLDRRDGMRWMGEESWKGRGKREEGRGKKREQEGLKAWKEKGRE